MQSSLASLYNFSRREASHLFNIGFSELIVILLIAFLIVGPKDLPKVARWLGRSVKKMRLLIRELKQETGWDAFEKELNDTKDDIDVTISDLKRDMDVTSDLKDASKEVETGIKGVQKELQKAQQVFHVSKKS